MNITVIGSGYVGLVTGTCFAEVGHHVVCLDIDPAKIALLNSGGVPIYEPGLSEMILRNRNNGRLHFTTDAAAATRHGSLQFIAVGTPPDEDGSADMQHVLAAARSIGRHMVSPTVVVNKSTVPVGTGERVQAAVAQGLAERNLGAGAPEFAVASNPEFLKEGAAIEDFMHADRIVIGTPPGPAGEWARTLLNQLYAPLDQQPSRLLHMDIRSAELTKYAANAMLATRISLMNELANFASQVGVDIEQVRKGIGADPRIGSRYLNPGAGYGGSCLPKDVQAMVRMAADAGVRLRVLEAVEAVNQAQKHRLAEMTLKRFGNDLSGHCFALWGLAFKPDTDDMREAPSRVLIRTLLERGASIVAHDPVATNEARRALAQDLADQPSLLAQMHYADSPMEAARGADAVIIVTEWQVFKSADLNQLKALLKTPVIFDGRNLYDLGLRSQGFEYYAIGR